MKTQIIVLLIFLFFLVTKSLVNYIFWISVAFLENMDFEVNFFPKYKLQYFSKIKIEEEKWIFTISFSSI